MTMKLILFVLGAVLAHVSAQRRPVGLGYGDDSYPSAPGCGPCIQEDCRPPPENCEAGTVLDTCNCCLVCGKKEFERCDHPSAPADDQGRCGENLVCKVRDDLGPDEPAQAVCFCSLEGTLCGSDGNTYANLCELTAYAKRSGNKITVSNKGPCNAAPMIVSAPENAKDRVGKNVALVCEATGYPIPAIEWTWTRVDGKTEFLPSDDMHISVNMRGGPEKWQVTGWLQVMDLQEHHEGDYTCIAQNTLGMDKAVGRIIVTEDRYGQKISRNDRRDDRRGKYRTYKDEY